MTNRKGGGKGILSGAKKPQKVSKRNKKSYENNNLVNSLKKKPELLEKIKYLNQNNVKVCFIIFAALSFVMFISLGQVYLYF